MSSFAVTVQPVLDVQPHPNADRLEVATILGWQCVVGKGQYKVGDLCVYFPIDSVLPEELEKKIFGADSKITLEKHRVRTIKIRGQISQGLAVHPNTLLTFHVSAGDDLTDYLQVKKHEPAQVPQSMRTGMTSKKKHTNPNFFKYTDIENIKNYPNELQKGELVWATEKIHGTNFRAGYVPVHANTLLKKLKKFFGLLPKWEFVYGSRTVQLQDKVNPTTWHGKHTGAPKNVYKEMVDKYDLKNVIPYGEVWYGEIYGEGIQKNYSYGLKGRDVAFFDIMKDGIYLDWGDISGENHAFGPCSTVPTYGLKRYDPAIKMFWFGSSSIDDSTTIEGFVVKPLHERTSRMGRVILKVINPDYLLKDQTEYH